MVICKRPVPVDDDLQQNNRVAGPRATGVTGQKEEKTEKEKWKKK